MATDSPVYLAYNYSPNRFGYPEIGSFIIDEGTTAPIVAYSTSTTQTLPTSYYVYDGARAILGVGATTTDGIGVRLSLAPGGHAITVLTAASGALVRSDVLNLFQLPAPVGGGITADNTSSDFAPLLKGGYQIQFVNPANAIQLVDGVISLDARSNEGNLARLYQGLLGRTYDATGLGFYDVQLANGRSLADVAAQIMASTEYTAAHGTQTDADFVANLYSGFLHRGASPQDNIAYQVQLAAGVSRGTIAAAFATSSEATSKLPLPDGVVFARDGIGTLVNQVYQAGLNRTADLGGAATYKAFLAAGGSAQSFVAAITGSAEFATVHGKESNQNYMVDLYQSSLGRAPDAGGLQDYTQRLDAGTLSRADALLAISTSSEAMARLPTSL